MVGVLIGFAIIVAVIAVGYLVGRLDLLGEHAQHVLSRLAFFVLSPALLFTVLSEADVSHLFSSLLPISAIAAVANIAVFLVVSLLIWRRPLPDATIGALASGYVNANNIGLPVSVYVLGDASSSAPVILLQLIVLAPIVMRRERWHEAHFRLQLIASILIFAVLFNHQSESPSYVIAMLGIAVWFATSERAAWRVALVVFAMLLVNGGSSGILSRDLYQRFYLAYLLKTVPLIPIWIVVQLELHGLLRNRRDDSELGEADAGDVTGREAVTHRR
jgi:hypothetical protein